MIFWSIGTVAALLLITLLPIPTDADYVTWAKCSRYGRRERVRDYPSDTGATWLNLAYCRLKNVTINDFDGLPNLEFLWLQYNDIANVDTNAFRSLPNLTKLELGYNQLNEMPVFVENSCPKLTELFLWNNKIKTIDNADTFYACSKLERLFLSNNDIEHLHEDIIKSLSNLKELYLYDNHINYIPDQMFISSKLERLDLHSNLLSYLPGNFVSNLPSLTQFDFSNNPWKCECLLELQMELKSVSNKNLSYSEETKADCLNSTQTCHRRVPSEAIARLG